jgi:hypothetical protein
MGTPHQYCRAPAARCIQGVPIRSSRSRFITCRLARVASSTRANTAISAAASRACCARSLRASRSTFPGISLPVERLTRQCQVPRAVPYPAAPTPAKPQRSSTSAPALARHQPAAPETPPSSAFPSHHQVPGPACAYWPPSMASTIFEATADTGTLYVPAASAAWIDATFSVRTPSSETACETSLPAVLNVARSLSSALPAVPVATAFLLLRCGRRSGVHPQQRLQSIQAIANIHTLCSSQLTLCYVYRPHESSL